MGDVAIKLDSVRELPTLAMFARVGVIASLSTSSAVPCRLEPAMEKVFRDPVHNLLGFDHDQDRLVLELIETREVQRLRNIKLMGTGYVVYPGADHNRFSHSLGATYLMKRVIERMTMLEADPSYRELVAELRTHRELMLAASLCHDIGHYPFSHLLENFAGEHHERWTVRLLRDPSSDVHQVLRSAHPDYPEWIAQIVERTFKPSFAVKLISSQLDVDRMDYLLRDSVHTGVGYGRFDLEWLLHSLRIVPRADDWEIAVDQDKGVRAVESYVLARYYMYQQVYHHKTGRAASAMLIRLLQRAADLLEAGDDLFVTHALQKMLRNVRSLTAEEFVQLDDVSLIYAVRQWAHAADPVLADLATRFLRRQIFKTIPIEPGRYKMQRADIADVAQAAGFDPRYYLVLDRAVSDPYSDGLFQAARDEVSENIYLVDRRLQLAELSEHSELIRAVTNRVTTHDRLCLPAELRREIEALLG